MVGDGVGVEPGSEDGGPGGGGLVECRTVSLAGERILIGVFGLMVAVGGFLIVAGLVGSFFVTVAFGALFAGMSLFSGRIMLVLTASQLSFDPSTGLLGWRSTFQRSGTAPVGTLSSIRRDRRPGVYAFRFRDASHVPFWLSRRSPDVVEYFRVIRASNPGIVTDELYTRSRAWWRGLPKG